MIKNSFPNTVTKWDLEGEIWEKGEFTGGNLIGFEIKEGKPFDPNQIIESSPFGNWTPIDLRKALIAIRLGYLKTAI